MQPEDPAVVLRAIELTLVNMPADDFFRRFYTERFDEPDGVVGMITKEKRQEWMERFDAGGGLAGFTGHLDPKSMRAFLKIALDEYRDEARRSLVHGELAMPPCKLCGAVRPVPEPDERS